MADNASGATGAPKDAEPTIAARNRAVLDKLPFSDTRDFDDARRGFIDTIEDAHVVGGTGRVVSSMRPYKFLDEVTAPSTVNPSLWRQARLNAIHGLFEVVPGIYQVRGFDIANMTLVEGEKGVIVVDTLTSIEAAREAIALYRRHRGDRPISAIIYTHTHTDHWGGGPGVIDEADARSGRVPVIAPDEFMELAVSENVLAGNAMLRRGQYQFGGLLPKGPRQHVDCGLGKSMTAGTVAMIAPNDFIRETGEERVIDGVRFIFQMAPDTEAPAEMHFYLPAFKALNLAENATHNFHNLLPFRGAQVRNSLDWSGYIDEAIDLWGGEAEVLLGQHHWPVWGQQRVAGYLVEQRDLYKYLHDQTVRLMNHGLKSTEIAETIRMPESLEAAWHTRGYYGHYRHNAKAIYQFYLGWYDSNPANLDSLPPVETGRKMVAYMGGAASILVRARADLAKGEHRFVAQVLSHLVFAEPDNGEARELLADTFEQLGYQSESATWRNAYLFGAQELRLGLPKVPARSPISGHVLRALSALQIFGYLAVRLNGPKAQGVGMVLNWRIADTEEALRVTLSNGALTVTDRRVADKPDATVTLAREHFNAIVDGRRTLEDAISSGDVRVDGDATAPRTLFALFDNFERMFEIVEPRRRAIS